VVIAMPESFDGMLAELADAAGQTVALPDLAAVRRRAGQRTVRRRMTASALAFALLCVSGVAGAAIDGRLGRPNHVNALSAPGASSAAAGASGTASPAPEATASSGAAVLSAGSFVGVWKTAAAQGDYLMVFPDGVVGLNQTDGSMCYGQVAIESSASQAASVASAKAAGNADAGTGLLSAATPTATPTVTPTPTSSSSSSVAVTASGGSVSSLFTLPFAELDCDDLGAAKGLMLSQVNGGSALTLVAASKTTGADTSYSRALGLSSTGVSGDKTLPRITGDWVSAGGGKKQTLTISDKGVVRYLAFTGADSPTIQVGSIDAYYSVGARVLTDCSNAAADSSYCGVLLIQPGANLGQIVVYAASGPETFLRSG
jgi:hypothetical protein